MTGTALPWPTKHPAGKSRQWPARMCRPSRVGRDHVWDRYPYLSRMYVINASPCLEEQFNKIRRYNILWKRSTFEMANIHIWRIWGRRKSSKCSQRRIVIFLRCSETAMKERRQVKTIQRTKKIIEHRRPHTNKHAKQNLIWYQNSFMCATVKQQEKSFPIRAATLRRRNSHFSGRKYTKKAW